MARKSKIEEPKTELIRQRLKPKSSNQEKYIRSIETYTLTICLSVAGAGKTFIAVSKAAEMLVDGRIKKVVISRPIIECGGKLGFLPGTVLEKVDPYMRAIYDVLRRYFTSQQLHKLIEDGIIEICPLEYMRGRTFDDCVVILDECQNAKYVQLKMIVTRVGENCRLIINGDYTQSDLEFAHKGDIFKFIDKLKDKEDIAIVRMNADDVQRSSFVQKIVEYLGDD